MQKNQLFKSPLSKDYWILSSKELKSTNMLVLAAVITALRIAIKMLKIPVGPNLNITFGFFINAVGSMIYGPVVAVIASAISDTVGAILFPSGTYFFPYIFTEISGGVIFALFFYRAKITNLRIILARFAVTVITNLLIDPTITYYYYLFYLGKSYTFFSIPRIIKNLALFPLQCLLLIIFLNVVIPITNRFGYTYMGKVSLKPEKKDIILIAVLTLVSAVCVVLYYVYKGVITF